MKLLNTTTATLALVTPVLSADWNCYFGGGPGHDGLRRIHADFNRLFGNSRLQIASHQCYAAICGGLTFGICNDSGVTRWEVSNHRNIAKDTDPGPGGSCLIKIDVIRHPYLEYIYGNANNIRWGASDDVRRC